MPFAYHKRLENDLGRWVEKGMLDADTADRLLQETRDQQTGYSFAQVVTFLGVICLCFAAMTFVAANWQDMSRLARVALILAGIWASYALAVGAHVKQQPAIANAFVVLGCGLFGAGIMLVGQMYHLQGRPTDAVWLWALGSLVASAALRSTGALWLTVALFTLWFFLGYRDDFQVRTEAEINWTYLAMLAVCGGLAYWLRSRTSAHLIAIGGIMWLYTTVAILTDRHDTLAYMFAVYAVLFVSMAAMFLSMERGQVLRGFEPVVVIYLVICMCVMTAAWIAAQDHIVGRPGSDYWTTSLWPMVVVLIAALGLVAFAAVREMTALYDVAVCAGWVALSIFTLSSVGTSIPYLADAFALALSIWLIRMGGRQAIPSVSRIGYAAFAAVMLLIYFRTAGSLLGTSGFYFATGLLLVLGAIFLPRLLRRNTSSDEATS